MAFLPESGLWAPGVYQWEVEDGPEGGADGIDNVPLRHLTDRAGFLNNARLSGYIAGKGRNLLTVLGVSTIPDAMAALHERCAGPYTPNFHDLMIGDYLDGIDLSAIPAENGGTAGQPWSDAYANNRIIISGFNPYIGVGQGDNRYNNHIRFDFPYIPLMKRMNPTNDNTGGYAATELRAFLDGTNGDGTGSMEGVTTAAFLNALKAQIGDHIHQVMLLLSTKNDGWAWGLYSLWIPGENEIFGVNTWGEPDWSDGQKLHIPLYQKSFAYRIKRYNGARTSYFLNTPTSSSAASFCYVSRDGLAISNLASSVGGCAPAFCVE
jgi:hypothetical protein